MKYQFVKNNEWIFPIEKMGTVLKLNSSCYYKWKNRPNNKRLLLKEKIKQQITSIYFSSKQRYESPRIAFELNSLGYKISRITVAKYMKELGLRSKLSRKFKITTNSGHNYWVAENVLARKPAQVWISDITYIQTKEGFLYLTTVIDLFDRKVSGWSLSETMKAQDTSMAVLKMARLHRSLQDHDSLIFHSDMGIQYAYTEFTSIVGKNITQSMSGKGNCYDNAVAESFFKTLKTELVYQNKYKTIKTLCLNI